MQKPLRRLSTQDVIVSIVGSLASSALMALVAQTLKHLQLVSGLISTLVIPTLLGATTFLLIYKFYIIRFTVLRPDFDFRLLQKTLVYTYVDMVHLKYDRQITLKALRTGLDRYCDHYHWTGTGRIIKSCPPPLELEDAPRTNVWHCYYVKFGRTLNKTETYPIQVNFDLEDTARTAVPFFSAHIDEPTDQLKFVLNLPRSIGVTKAVGKTCWGIEARIPLETIDLPVKKGKLEWVIDKPKLFHYYEVMWSFPGTGTHEHPSTTTTKQT